MKENTGAITIHGNPLTLLGTLSKVGDKLPMVELLDGDLKPVNLGSFKDKTVVLVTVPSLDTPICDTETRWFNKEATALSKDIAVVVVSMDLPFAQKRWCGAAGVSNVTVLSDYRDANLGNATGLLIKELRLLARSVIVADKNGKIQYVQLVKEVASEPNYEDVLKAVKEITK